MLGSIKDVFSGYYQLSLEHMLKAFCDDHLRCSFGNRSNRTCAGTRFSHGMEHRTQDGKIIGAGHYISDLAAESYLPIWIKFLKDELDECEKEYLEALDEEPPEISSGRIASNLHFDQIDHSFTEMGTAAPFISHVSCFGCLVNIPLHPLTCGHVLCNNCIRTCGRKAHGKILLEYCPLHIRTRFFEPLCEVTCLSDNVGVRVLSLDGGGMRGIMELEVLRAIEKALGGNIRIQAFFDLVVGTSTGGINALALGVKQWSVRYCIQKFEKFCDQAFTQREFRGLWILEQAVLLNHGSKYKATPLHNVLRETLGTSPLFGANDDLHAFKNKVAVTATSADGNEAMIIANYNRPQSPGDSQTFVRPENPSHELQLWEAAAATSAAPLYFKPYTHTRTGTSYLDGGLYHNNPVHIANRERKLLWPAIANKHPDMLLSIGTGQNLSESRREALERRSSSPKNDNTPNTPTNKPGGIRRTLNALYQRFDNILDAEHTWTEFEADINNRNEGFSSPYIRLNLDLKSKLPPFDAKDKFQEFRAEVRRRLKDPDVMEKVRDIACSLVASSFYFKPVKTVPLRGGSFMCTGYICCKFEEGSSNLKALGEFLSKQCTSDFTPKFVVQDTSRCAPGRGVKVQLTEKVVSRLTTYGMLSIPHLDFEVPNAMASTTIALVLQEGCQDSTQRYLLSGFPRTLVQEASCKPSDSTHDSRSTSTSINRDRRSRHQPQTARTERHPMQDRPSESPALPPRPPQVRPPLPARPKSSSQPYPYAAHSRMDSAVELPHYARVPKPPQQSSTPEDSARPQSVPVYQAFSYEQPMPRNDMPTNLVERVARKVQFENERRLRKSRGGDEHSSPKRLVKKRDIG